MKIIPVQPEHFERDDKGGTTKVARSASRRTFGRFTPSRRTFGRFSPSRRTFGRFSPSRRTF